MGVNGWPWLDIQSAMRGLLCWPLSISGNDWQIDMVAGSGGWTVMYARGGIVACVLMTLGARGLRHLTWVAFSAA